MFSLVRQVGQASHRQLHTTFTKAGGMANSRWPSIAEIASIATTAAASSSVLSCDVENGTVRTQVVLRDLESMGGIKIAGAMYNLETGIVEFLA